MLTPAWYLIDGDIFGDLPVALQVDTVQSALSAVTQTFGDEGEFSPRQTAAVIYLALLAAEHLNDEMTYNARRHDAADLARLLHSLNLLQANWTQTIQKMAVHADKRIIGGLAALPAAAVNTVVDNLHTAGATGSICAGNLKKAYLALRLAIQ
jgi:hypothetical protein